MTGSARIVVGDARRVLATLPAQSVQCCVSSPPYYGLRDYGTAKWEGGAANCDHVAAALGGIGRETISGGTSNQHTTRTVQFRDACGKCGAARIDSQLGLERTPDEYVANMVAVFREVRRVLRDDGVLWLNLGDSYASDTKGSGGDGSSTTLSGTPSSGNGQLFQPRRVQHGLKPKDLVGIPWLVAFALRADGWYLRSDCIWAKPNPMPESVTDRPTKAHEYLFLLSKSGSYYYDADAIAEPLAEASLDRQRYALNYTQRAYADGTPQTGGRREPAPDDRESRNRRTVWTIATQPYSGAHFAVMPEALVEPCILAGTSEKGACAKCGAPWENKSEPTGEVVASDGRDQFGAYESRRGRGEAFAGPQHQSGEGGTASMPRIVRRSLGWSPTCDCGEQETRPCVVLDPFAGSGTVGVVALKRGRSFLGVELNPKYAQLAHDRIEGDAPLLNRAEVGT